MNSPPSQPKKSEIAKRILIVDDDKDVTDFLIRSLRERGFQVSTLNDPVQAAARAEEFRPHLIILDFDMPRILGSELAVLLKSGSGTKNVPILFLSGMTDPDHHEIAAYSGAAAYLDKPIDQVRLLETIRKLLEAGGNR